VNVVPKSIPMMSVFCGDFPAGADVELFPAGPALLFAGRLNAAGFRFGFSGMIGLQVPTGSAQRW